MNWKDEGDTAVSCQLMINFQSCAITVKFTAIFLLKHHRRHHFEGILLPEDF